MSEFGRHGARSRAGIRRWALLAAAEAVAAGLASVPDARTALSSYLVLFASGCLVAFLAARSLSASGPGFLLASGALLRATLLLRAPDLSDDLKRYAWDARVSAAGISPYAHAPSESAISRLAPEAAATVPHADVRSVYPPAAQAAFRAGRWLGGELALKAVFAVADLSIVALLYALGGSVAGYAAALYAFHPLPVTESAGQGHLDSLGVALLLATLVWIARARPVRAGTAFALAVLTKYVPLFCALPVAKRGGWRFAASAAALAAALWVAATRGGVSPVGGLSDYARRWEFNSLAYPALGAAYDSTGLPEAAKAAFNDWRDRPAWAQPLFSYFYPGFFARATLAALLAAALLVIALRVREIETAVFASLAALLLASPTLHPWYLLWVLPLAARGKNPAFLYLSSSVVLSYALLFPLPWLSRPAVYALEYGPFLALLVVPASVRRRA